MIVDDHATFADALRHALGDEPGIDVVAVATDAEGAKRLASSHRPDVALVDHRIADDDGIDLVRDLHTVFPEMQLVMVTATTEETTVLRALQAGCSGYVLKSSPLETVVDAVRSAANGDAFVPPALLARLLPRIRERDRALPPPGSLTDRELDVLRLLSRGLANAAVATELSISVNTVRNHVQNVLTKLGAHSKLEAVAKARESGLL